MGYIRDDRPRVARTFEPALDPSQAHRYIRYRPTREESAAEKALHNKEKAEQREHASTIEIIEEMALAGEIDLKEMGQQLLICCPTSYRVGRLPEPTNAEPGSAEKIAILRDRIARGESTSHPNDAYYRPQNAWYCPGTPRPIVERMDPEVRRLHQQIELAISRQDFEQLRKLQEQMAALNAEEEE